LYPAAVRDIKLSKERLTSMMDVIRARNSADAERLVRLYSIESAHSAVEHLTQVPLGGRQP